MKYKTKVPPVWALTLAKQYQVLLHADAGILRFAPIAVGGDLALEARKGKTGGKKCGEGCKSRKR